MLDCVQDGNFSHRRSHRIIGHSLWYRILPFKQVRLVIIDSDLKYILRYVHNSPVKVLYHKIQISFYNYRFRLYYLTGALFSKSLINTNKFAIITMMKG